VEHLYTWILDGPAWIRYVVFSELLNLPPENPRRIDAAQRMREDENICTLLSAIQGIEKTLLKRHNDAGHILHKLAFLAELGFNKEDPEIRAVILKILTHQSEDGPFQILSNYPTRFGGSGLIEWLWALCDAPTLTYALVRFGLQHDEHVRASIEYMVNLVVENGWPCAASKTLGKFKGPGKRSDPCPYANLIMLKLLSALPQGNYQNEINIGIETLLNLWQNSLNQHPFLFRMGNDFRKLKVPFVWYDILHVAEVLSRFPQCHNDQRFLEIVQIILSKANNEGKFISESIWTKWKGWEFCQKKDPSRWVTTCVLRIQKRIASP